MPLTSEQISEILSGIGPTATTASGERRRRAYRVKHRDQVTIIPCHDSGPRKNETATMTDFSSRGVAIHCAMRVPAGSHLILVLPRQTGKSLQLLCAVAHCRKRADGNYSIGAEFVGVAPGAISDAPAASAGEADRIANSILN
ncbi:MAG TPA: PilZ domain-containing protein [Tepidisphaeraceae bacterium]|nr:PilZ domain-containing protein [Tepidisphaeraceae bacterium]